MHARIHAHKAKHSPREFPSLVMRGTRILFHVSGPGKTTAGGGAIDYAIPTSFTTCLPCSWPENDRREHNSGVKTRRASLDLILFHRRRKREATRTLVCIVSTYLITNTPNLLITIWEHVHIDSLRSIADGTMYRRVCIARFDMQQASTMCFFEAEFRELI
uniref:Uncharacterized protein n=1 Tax=Ascaris lumbricoides TaxID=6252 RepID=A0A0M3HFX7_ASCLU